MSAYWRDMTAPNYASTPGVHMCADAISATGHCKGICEIALVRKRQASHFILMQFNSQEM